MQMDGGRSEALTNDTKALKEDMMKNFRLLPDFDCIGHFTPSLASIPKRLWGFFNDQTGKLLCPVGRNFEDPELILDTFYLHFLHSYFL